MVTFLLNTALTDSHYYWFDMWHMPTIRRAAYSDRERENVHPALVYGMVAIGLRQRQSRRRTYGSGVGETLIPDEAIPPASNPNDISELIKEAANTFLEQDLASPDRDFRSWLDTAKAALMLMQLEHELSPRYLHLLGIARTVLRSTNLIKAIQAEAKITNGNQFQNSPIQKEVTADVSRSSIEMEEAARLALLPLWIGTRTGIAYFNVEIHQTGFEYNDVSQSYVFATWPDGQPEEFQKKSKEKIRSGTSEREEMANNTRARIMGLNAMYSNFMARSLPYDCDYSNPIPLLNRALRNLDDMEFMFEMMSEVVDWLEPSYFRTTMMRFCTAVCYLHGVIIRRVGFAHCDSLRQGLVASIKSSRSSDGNDNDGSSPPTNNNNNNNPASSSTPSSSPKHFQSAILRGWCKIQQIYISEMDLDYISCNGQGHLLQMTKFQSDVIRLYWLGTQHLYRGVKKSLIMVGNKNNYKEDEVYSLLYKTSQELGMRIKRHDQATTGRVSSSPLVSGSAESSSSGGGGGADGGSGQESG